MATQEKSTQETKPGAFQAAINLVKGTTETIVTKVEDIAMNAMVSSFLGGDERIVEGSFQSTEESRADTGKAEPMRIIPREKEDEIKNLREELQCWKNKAKDLEEMEQMRERTTILSHQLAQAQEYIRKRELELIHKLEDAKNELQKEKLLYGKEMAALAQQVVIEREKHLKERKYLEEEISFLRKRVNELEISLSEKELEVDSVKEQLKSAETKEKQDESLKSAETKGKHDESLQMGEELKPNLGKEENIQKRKEKKQKKKKGEFAQELKPKEMGQQTQELKKAEEKEKPRELQSKETEGMREIGGMEFRESKEKKSEMIEQLKPSGEFKVNREQMKQSEKKESSQQKVEELKPTEEAEELKQEEGEQELLSAKELKPEDTEELPLLTEKTDNIEEEEEEVEVALTEEEIANRLKEAHHGSGVPIPAKKAGHRRIKQNQKGPHIILKPKLVEQREEKRQAERMGETVESASQEIVKQEHETELALKAETMKRIALQKADPHSKAIPSAYFPPEKPTFYDNPHGSAHLHPFEPTSRGRQFHGQQ